MAKSNAQLSVAELEQLLTEKKSELGTLQKERERLQKQLVEVDQKIASLTGKKRRVAAGGKRKRVVRRPKNVKPLHETVVDVLSPYKKGLALGELHDKIIESGYKTRSSNFKNVLYQCLYKSADIAYDASTKKYLAAKTPAAK